MKMSIQFGILTEPIENKKLQSQIAILDSA